MNDGHDKRTYFAPAERASSESLLDSIDHVAHSQMVTALLRSSTAMLCVLNEHRQILTLNAAYLDTLQVDNADDVLGLRPGEAIDCTHSREHPAGCGTGPHCRTCGAAIAIVAAQRTGKAVQRECVLTARDRKGRVRDLSFLVRASPCNEAKHSLLVLSLMDNSAQKLHASLERAILHDLSNIVGALSATAELLKMGDVTETVQLTNDVCDLTQRLTRELLLHKLLMSEQPNDYRQNWQQASLSRTVAFIQRLFANHPVATSKQLVIETRLEIDVIQTDASLLERVLTNMLINAFEASSNGQVVKLTLTSNSEHVLFSVWNASFMDENVASRVFQRYYSTKKGLGRGQGTYAMRLIGEQLLGGHLDFSTSSHAGTTFTLDLPTNAKPNARRSH